LTGGACADYRKQENEKVFHKIILLAEKLKELYICILQRHDWNPCVSPLRSFAMGFFVYSTHSYQWSNKIQVQRKQRIFVCN